MAMLVLNWSEVRASDTVACWLLPSGMCMQEERAVFNSEWLKPPVYKETQWALHDLDQWLLSSLM